MLSYSKKIILTKNKFLICRTRFTWKNCKKQFHVYEYGKTKKILKHYDNMFNVLEMESNKCRKLGISQLNAIYKILSTIILRWFKKYTAEIIDEYQWSFMKGKFITDYIFTVKPIIEKFYEHDQKLHAIYRLPTALTEIDYDQQLWILEFQTN